MMNQNFKVTMSHKGTLTFIVCFAVIEAFLIWAIFFDDFRLLGIVFSALLFIVFFLAELTTLLYKVQVNGSSIVGRTKWGKRFDFSLLEIAEIICDTQYRRGNSQVEEITIRTSTDKVIIEQTMNGFQSMAIYLLDNLENGKINNTAISASSKRRLNQYMRDKNYRYLGEEKRT
jgi:hypothetical protein